MYDEKDLKRILTRAFEIQNRTKGSGVVLGSHEKLSLDEIEEIASESGLSPEFVRQAVVEFEGVPIEEPFFLDTGRTPDGLVSGMKHAMPSLRKSPSRSLFSSRRWPRY